MIDGLFYRESSAARPLLLFNLMNSRADGQGQVQLIRYSKYLNPCLVSQPLPHTSYEGRLTIADVTYAAGSSPLPSHPDIFILPASSQRALQTRSLSLRPHPITHYDMPTYGDS